MSSWPVCTRGVPRISVGPSQLETDLDLIPALDRTTNSLTMPQQDSSALTQSNEVGKVRIAKRTLIKQVPAPTGARATATTVSHRPAYSRLVTQDNRGKTAIPILPGLNAVTIGRHPQSTYTIDSEHVSLRHCQVYIVSPSLVLLRLVIAKQDHIHSWKDWIPPGMTHRRLRLRTAVRMERECAAHSSGSTL